MAEDTRAEPGDISPVLFALQLVTVYKKQAKAVSVLRD